MTSLILGLDLGILEVGPSGKASVCLVYSKDSNMFTRHSSAVYLVPKGLDELWPFQILTKFFDGLWILVF